MVDYVRPHLMGILNCTPDSFSDGGQFFAVGPAVSHALSMLDEGAHWVDLGGESTRPGAPAVPADVELSRVLPVLEAVLAARPGARLSVDTYKPEVARAALEAGACCVNDVRGLSEPGMAALCAETGCEVVLMHHRGTPETMHSEAVYGDLISEVVAELGARLEAAVRAGVRAERVWLDPGVGFAKAGLDNARLVAGLAAVSALGCPVLVGASRKRFIGELTGEAVPAARLAGSLGAALAAARAGAGALRVHDVGATRQALDVFIACGGLA